MSKTIVIGHMGPDTDSTCSPIVYAWYLREFHNVDATAYLAGNPNREAEFVLEHFGVDMPEIIDSIPADSQLVLIDTNNPEELLPGYEDAQIVEIVDHHKLHGLKTNDLVKVTMRPYGSIPSVFWELMSEATENLPREMAGLMLAPIISDTLKFTSVTTTETDKEVAFKLADMAKIDIDELANLMFAAKSNLDGMNPREILLADHKNFEFGGKKYKLAVLETTDPSQALGMLDALRPEMDQVVAAESLAGMFYFVVDILKSEAQLVVSAGMEEAATQAFKAEFTDGIMPLPGIVSRKKQMAPALEAVLG